MNTLAKTKEVKSIYQQTLNLTEENSVIITRYYDKTLFPERRTVFGALDDNNMNKIYAKISAKLPLYYLNFSLSEDAIKYLNDRKLKEANLQIKKIKVINSDFSLYQIMKQ